MCLPLELQWMKTGARAPGGCWLPGGPVRGSQGWISWANIRNSTLRPLTVLWAIIHLSIRKSVPPHLIQIMDLDWFALLEHSVCVQWLSHVRLFVSPWTAAQWSSLFFTISRSLLKLMFIESVMPCNHLILCHPLLLLHSIFPSIRVFSNESALLYRVHFLYTYTLIIHC